MGLIQSLKKIIVKSLTLLMPKAFCHLPPQSQDNCIVFCRAPILQTVRWRREFLKSVGFPTALRIRNLWETMYRTCLNFGPRVFSFPLTVSIKTLLCNSTIFSSWDAKI